MSLITITKLASTDSCISFQYNNKNVSIPYKSISGIHKHIINKKNSNPMSSSSSLSSMTLKVIICFLKNTSVVKWLDGKPLESFETGLSKKEYYSLIKKTSNVSSITNSKGSISMEPIAEQVAKKPFGASLSKTQKIATTHLYSLIILSRKDLSKAIDVTIDLNIAYSLQTKKSSRLQSSQSQSIPHPMDCASKSISVDSDGISFQEENKKTFISYTEVIAARSLNSFTPTIRDTSFNPSFPNFSDFADANCVICCYLKCPDKTTLPSKEFTSPLTESDCQSLAKKLNQFCQDSSVKIFPENPASWNQDKGLVIVRQTYSLQIKYISDRSLNRLAPF
ncbi:MAG: hypothetical protein V4487_07735 [Chlamydiota bacterium]